MDDKVCTQNDSVCYTKRTCVYSFFWAQQQIVQYICVKRYNQSTFSRDVLEDFHVCAVSFNKATEAEAYPGIVNSVVGGNSGILEGKHVYMLSHV